MPVIPYSRQEIHEDDVAAVTAVLRSDFLTQGPVVPRFEAAFAAVHGVAHAVAVSNATAALHIGCLALGIGPGSLVWTSPNSFLASANCALYCGADIDFVDIDPGTRNMSVSALREKLADGEKVGRLPQLLIPVDFAGLPCDLREMRELADRYGFFILEDASHATGAIYHGAPVGSMYSDIAVFSLHAVKIVTTAEGGVLVTQRESVAARLRMLRSHGMTRDPGEMERPSEGGWYYEQQRLGFNYRLTEVQAALGLSQLGRLATMHRRRVELADRYDQILADLPLLLPARATDSTSAWHLYVIELDERRTRRGRSEVFQFLRVSEVGVNVHYIPIHTQPYYERLGFMRGDFPAAERFYSRALSLPLYPAMTDAQQDYVVDVLRRAIG